MLGMANLEIQLTSAVDLQNVELWGKQDPYCVLSCDTNRARSVTHKDGGKFPVWNQTFVFKDVTEDSTLTIEIFDENYFVRETKIGFCKIRLKSVVDPGFLNVQAPVYNDRRQQQGFLNLQLRYREQGAPVGASGRPQLTKSITNSEPADKFSIFYKLGHVISQDAHSRTFEVTSTVTGQRHACKVVSKRRLSTNVERASVQQEISIMRMLASHPNVVKFDQSFEDNKHVYIITELCAGGPLFQRLSRQGSVTEFDAAKIMRSVLDVVAFCHSKGISHRALTPDSLLFASPSPDAQIKVSNFSCAALFKEGESFFDLVGDVQYRAPEVLRKNYGKEADIWACGIVLYVLLSGRYPFTGKTDREVCEAVLRSEMDLEIDPWSSISAPAKDCVRRMLMRDPHSRPSATELLTHKWIVEGGLAGKDPIQTGVLQKLKSFGGANRLRQEVQLLMARNLPASEIQRLQAMFKEFDPDGNGCVTLAELQAVLKKNGALKDEDLKALLASSNMSGDGTVDYEEFIAATISLEKLNREEKFREAFEHFDLDGNGFISPEELRHALKSMNVSDMDDIISQVDADNDGQINYLEFCSMMANTL